MVWIPFSVMREVMMFALDNAIVKLGENQLRRQIGGIPMGDPISPGMTIGTCGWMEDCWMETLAPEVKEMFKAKRYMDDILMVYAKNDRWDHEKFVADFEESTCYHPPLKLEDGRHDTFLETTFEWKGDHFSFWLKNDNERGRPQTVWRYKDFRSHEPFAQKKALITMMARKVHKMASGRHELTRSAVQKLEEFRRLGYPRGLLRGVCNFMYATTREGAWMDARDEIMQT